MSDGQLRIGLIIYKHASVLEFLFHDFQRRARHEVNKSTFARPRIAYYEYCRCRLSHGRQNFGGLGLKGFYALEKRVNKGELLIFGAE